MSSSFVQREGVTDGVGSAGVVAGATFAINRGTYLFDMDSILTVVSLFKFNTKPFVNFFYIFIL